MDAVKAGVMQAKPSGFNAEQFQIMDEDKVMLHWGEEWVWEGNSIHVNIVVWILSVVIKGQYEVCWRYLAFKRKQCFMNKLNMVYA